MYKPIIVFAIVLASALPVSAGYVVDVLGTAGVGIPSSSIEIQPGGSFEGQVDLLAPMGIQLDSVVLRLDFDVEGLRFESGWFEWSTPFTTGGVDDFSVPAANAFGVIDQDTFADALSPSSIDTSFENLTDEFGDFFTTGTLISFTLSVPIDALPGTVYTISPVPDTFTNGASFVEAVAGSALSVNVVPEPTTLTLLLGGLCMLFGLRRQRECGARQRSGREAD